MARYLPTMLLWAVVIILSGCGEQSLEDDAQPVRTSMIESGTSDNSGHDSQNNEVSRDDHDSMAMVLVSGIYDPAAEATELNPIKVLPVTRVPPTDGAEVVAELVADGETVAEGSGSLDSFTDGDLARFTIYLPAVTGVVDELRVTVDGKGVGALSGSGEVPSVEIVEPADGTSYGGGDLVVQWRPIKPDEGLRYALYFSADGVSWRSVVGDTTDLAGTVPASMVPSGSLSDVRLLVTVSDGPNGSYTIAEPFDG